MKHQVIKLGESVAQAKLINGIRVEVAQVSQGEVSQGEVFDITEAQSKKLEKLKTHKGKLNMVNGIIKESKRIDKDQA